MSTTGTQKLLQTFEFEAIQKSPNVCYCLDAEFKLLYVNQAYLSFAEHNQGDEIPERFSVGSNLLDAIGGPLKEFYHDFFTRCLQAEKPTEHEYECSSPEHFRKFRMIVYPVSSREGMLVEHSLIIEKPHDRQEVEFERKNYIDENGILHQCGHCRRIKNLITSRWDWYPPAMEYKETSHGLCNPCLDYHYPDVD
jgi:hypothetical protein